MVDAHEKADTSHRDLSLDNIMLYKDVGKIVRVGYLIDWGVSRKTGNAPPRPHVLSVGSRSHPRKLSLIWISQGTPAYMSYSTLCGEPHHHTLKDDLKSFIYIVLYCALRWLPVKSGQPIRWWLMVFFGPGHWGQRGSYLAGTL